MQKKEEVQYEKKAVPEAGDKRGKAFHTGYALDRLQGFLHIPDESPQRSILFLLQQELRRFLMDSVSIKIADITVRVDSAIDLERFNDFGFYRNFITGAGSAADCRLDLKIAPAPRLDYNIGSFTPQGVWRLSRSGGNNVLQVGPPPRRGRPDNVVVFNSGYSAGVMYQKIVFEMFRRFIDQFLIINLLSKKSGFLLHASGVVWEGRGLGFIGPSGAGKSTLLKLFGERVERECMLNDDRLALRDYGGRWRVFGTPWYGESRVACSNSADLAALFFIRHAERNYLRKLPAGEVCRQLMVQALVPLWDEESVSGVLDTFQSLIGKIPAFELGFVPDERVIDFITAAHII